MAIPVLSSAVDAAARGRTETARGGRPLFPWVAAGIVFFLSLAVIAAVAMVYPRLTARPAAVTQPAPAPMAAVTWETAFFSFTAKDVEIVVDGQTYRPPADTVFDPLSGFVEAEWRDGWSGATMRLYIAIKSDGKRWWSEDIRTYNGETSRRADWVEYTGRFFNRPVGSDFEGNFALRGKTKDGKPASLAFTDLHLKVNAEKYMVNPLTSRPATQPATQPAPAVADNTTPAVSIVIDLTTKEERPAGNWTTFLSPSGQEGEVH